MHQNPRSAEFFSLLSCRRIRAEQSSPACWISYQSSPSAPRFYPLSQIASSSLGPHSTFGSFQTARNDNDPLNDTQSVTSVPSRNHPPPTTHAHPSRHHNAGHLHPLGLSPPKTLRAILFRRHRFLPQRRARQRNRLQVTDELRRQ
jgi:hypothetical protein